MDASEVAPLPLGFDEFLRDQEGDEDEDEDEEGEDEDLGPRSGLKPRSVAQQRQDLLRRLAKADAARQKRQEKEERARRRKWDREEEEFEREVEMRREEEEAVRQMREEQEEVEQALAEEEFEARLDILDGIVPASAAAGESAGEKGTKGSEGADEEGGDDSEEGSGGGGEVEEEEEEEDDEEEEDERKPRSFGTVAMVDGSCSGAAREEGGRPGSFFPPGPVFASMSVGIAQVSWQQAKVNGERGRKKRTCSR